MPEGPVTTILRGFKVPVAVLDRFLQANGIDETYGWPPHYKMLDEPSKLLRTKLGDAKTRLFIPHRLGYYKSTFAYIACDWIFVFAQRKILPKELPETAPPGFAELCNEIIGYANEQDREQLRFQSEDLTAMYVINTEDQSYWFQEPYVRKASPSSDVHCDDCDMTFETWVEKVNHRRDVHGSKESPTDLPSDL
ncbi:hypothetical protein C8A03DRAFT_18030 [Achaetomium macrosporum]|uniref:C2H2-type domain-containing protein n=1 Tax=Achaetomium macrosporum TaxID=79813 RepID=A0AAN7C4H0_9PEZI|nr:hypothetical protein C8A03DRAFT_18030 [Achaetomium macrosporum]